MIYSDHTVEVSVILRDSAGYIGMPEEYPTEPTPALKVFNNDTQQGRYHILGKDLMAIGAEEGCFDPNNDYVFFPSEVEEVQ